MNFESKLIPGTLIKRYKRFFVDVKVKNKIDLAHCPNTGSMFGLLNPGAKVWITRSLNPERKLKYTLQIIEQNGKKVGVNTHLTNKIFFESLSKNKITAFHNIEKIEKEKKYNNKTRFDFMIERNKKKGFIEVKNVTLSRIKKIAEFPDAVTSRGSKHLIELVNASKKGYEIFLVFVVQREDCDYVKIASDIDIEYSKLLTTALKDSLKILCYDCKFSPKGIKLNRQIKLKLNE